MWFLRDLSVVAGVCSLTTIVVVVVVVAAVAESWGGLETGIDDTAEKEEGNGEDNIWGNLVLRFTDISISELQETGELFHSLEFCVSNFNCFFLSCKIICLIKSNRVIQYR